MVTRTPAIGSYACIACLVCSALQAPKLCVKTDVKIISSHLQQKQYWLHIDCALQIKHILRDVGMTRSKLPVEGTHGCCVPENSAIILWVTAYSDFWSGMVLSWAFHVLWTCTGYAPHYVRKPTRTIYTIAAPCCRTRLLSSHACTCAPEDNRNIRQVSKLRLIITLQIAMRGRVWESKC